MIQVKKLLKQHILSKFVFGTTAIFISGCEQNLDYSQYLTLPEISLPTKLYKLESSTENLPKETGIINFSTYSIVRAKKGERVFQVADRINVSSKELALYNGLSENYKLNQGEILAVPNNAKKANKNKAVNIAKVASNAIDRVQTKEETLVEKSTELSEETNDASKTMDTSEEQASLSEEQTTNKPFLKPIEGEISTPFSYDTSGNQGINIMAPEGTPIKASNDGSIALVSRGENQVTIIFIKHNDNILSAYTNISDVNLLKGDIVKRGQIIGSVAPGKDFLHFEMIKDNQRVDPIQFFE